MEQSILQHWMPLSNLEEMQLMFLKDCRLKKHPIHGYRGDARICL